MRSDLFRGLVREIELGDEDMFETFRIAAARQGYADANRVESHKRTGALSDRELHIVGARFELVAALAVRGRWLRTIGGDRNEADVEVEIAGRRIGVEVKGKLSPVGDVWFKGLDRGILKSEYLVVVWPAAGTARILDTRRFVVAGYMDRLDFRRRARADSRARSLVVRWRELLPITAFPEAVDGGRLGEIIDQRRRIGAHNFRR